MRARALVAVAIVGAAGVVAAETRVYRAQNRPVDELAPLAEAALAGEGRVAIDARTASLILVGSRAALDRAVALVRQQDLALRTVVLIYDVVREADVHATDVSIDWAIEVGAFRVGRVPVGAPGVRLSARVETTRTGSELRGTLRLLEGGAGRIVTGRALPFVLATPYGDSAGFVAAEAGFEARVTVLASGRIALEIRPFDGRFEAGGLRYTSAATQLQLDPGETVAIGSVERSSDARIVDATGGFADRDASERQILLITVDLEATGSD